MSPKSKVLCPKSIAPSSNGQRLTTVARLILDPGTWIEDHRARRPTLDSRLWISDSLAPC